MSLKNYHNVTMDELREVLKEEKGWFRNIPEGSQEYAFDFKLSNAPHIVVRVCSGITMTGYSRGCGKDAIRVFALDTQANRGYIKTKRVYRIGSWSKNLRAAVLNCFNQSIARRDRL
jgi:hypothetical protein